MFAAELAHVMGRIDTARVDEHYRVVVGDDVRARHRSAGRAGAVGADALMRHDKKALDGLTFVLDGPDGVEVVPGVEDAPVLAAFHE